MNAAIVYFLLLYEITYVMLLTHTPTTNIRTCGTQISRDKYLQTAAKSLRACIAGYRIRHIQ
jgi:hypothetical protein